MSRQALNRVVGPTILVLVVLGAAVAFVTPVRTQTNLPEIVLYPADVSVIRGNWARLSATTGAGGQKMTSTDHGWPSPNAPLAAPPDYFEVTFNATAGVPYRLWLRLRASADSKYNESVWVQFSRAVTAGGAPLWPIGTAGALLVNLEDCSGCGVSGWGWQDNAYWLGTSSVVRFAATGSQTLRVQTREDGVNIDQIVLSAATYFSSPPGPVRNDSTIVPKGGSSGVMVLRGPYLQQVGESEATVVWTTREAGPADVQYRTATGPTLTEPADTRLFAATTTGFGFDFYQHEAHLTGLAAATRYTYDLLVRGIDATPFVTEAFTTAPPTGSSGTRFIVFGDSGVGSTPQRQLADRMTADTFDLALHAGDVAYGNTAGTGGGSYRQFDDWVFGVYRPWLVSRPFFPSIGNHDNEVANARPYRDVFVLPENGASPAFPDHAERFYSFDYGPVHFVALDTELAFQSTTRRSAQLQWLEADLAATTQPWKVVYLHRPPFNAGLHHGSDLTVRATFGPVFERQGVQLVIAGHEHSYQRSTPWRQYVATGAAVTYLVTGGGGAPLYPSGFAAWTAFSASSHHYVRTTITGCVARIEAVGLNGAVFDRFDLDRCQQATDLAAPAVSIVEPVAGATLTGNVAVRVSATDDIRVVKADLLVDGALKAVDGTAPFAWTLNTTSFSDGTHRLDARVYDLGGHVASSGARTVTVANGVIVPKAIPATIQSEDFDAGANGTAYLDHDAGNNGGQYRATDVDIATCAEGGFVVGWAGAGEWLNYTISVPQAGDYTLTARVASPATGGRFRVTFNGIDATGPLQVPTTGGWQTYRDVPVRVTLAAGVQVMRLVMDSNGSTNAVGNFNYIRLSSASP